MRRRKRPAAVVVAVVADTHINSTVGLCPPAVNLDDGGTYQASEAQMGLWRAWNSYWERVDELAKGHTLYVVVNGDAVEGFHHGSTQVVSANEADQDRMALEIFEPVARKAARLFFVRGTPAHAGKSAGREEMLAKDLGAEPDEVTGTASWWHLPLMAEGVLFSFAHHRRQTTLPWTHGGAANRLAAQTVYAYATSGDRRPDVVVRSHGHRFDESSRLHPVKVVFTPAFCLATEFVHRIAPDALADVGGLIFTCREGAFEWEPVRFPPRRRKPWSA
jgi:hypothetical protein